MAPATILQKRQSGLADAWDMRRFYRLVWRLVVCGVSLPLLRTSVEYR